MISDIERSAIALHLLHHGAENDLDIDWTVQELRWHGYVLDASTVVAHMTRLERAGLLDATSLVEDGHYRRTYRTSPMGLLTLERGRLIIERLAEELLGR